MQGLLSGSHGWRGEKEDESGKDGKWEVVHGQRPPVKLPTSSKRKGAKERKLLRFLRAHVREKKVPSQKTCQRIMGFKMM